jgi:hypothetical protein
MIESSEKGVITNKENEKKDGYNSARIIET